MAFYDKFPYTNFQEINLDRLIQELIQVKDGLDFVIENASLKYADPIQWNITHQYAANTVVIDPETGIAYISTKPVPDNILITNTDYWTPIFDLSDFFDQAFADIETERNERTAADEALEAQITEESEARTAAVTAEAAIRAAADGALEAQITEESEARTAADEDLQNQINNIDLSNKWKRGYVGMCRLFNSNATGLMYTEDFEHIYTVKRIPYISDAASLVHVGDWYYATYGNTYHKSKDLINWTAGNNVATNPYSHRTWAGVLSQLKDGSWIWMAAYQYLADSSTIENAVGANAYYFKIMYCPVTFDNDNGEIIFSTLHELSLGSHDSLIDPWMIWHEPTQYYYFAVKDEVECKIMWYRGTTYDSLTYYRTSPIVGIEAPSMVVADNGDIITTADYYITGVVNKLGQEYTSTQRTIYAYLYRDYDTRVPIYKTSFVGANLRHCTWRSCDEETYNLLMTMGIHAGAQYIGSAPFDTTTIRLYDKTGRTYDIYPEDCFNVIEVYQNIPSLTLNMMLDSFARRTDITLIARNTCNVTLGTGFVAAVRGKTFTVGPSTAPLIIKLLHNNFTAFQAVNP